MAHRICGYISEELKFILDSGVSGPPIIEDWKRANAYACRYQDENVILNAQVSRLNQQKDELVAALHELVSYVDHAHNNVNQPVAMRVAANHARATLAKAKNV